jgi:hypothetical protein
MLISIMFTITYNAKRRAVYDPWSVHYSNAYKYGTVQTNAQKYIKISLFTQRALNISTSHAKYKV